MSMPSVLPVFARLISPFTVRVAVSVRSSFLAMTSFVFRVLPAAKSSDDQACCSTESGEDSVADNATGASAQKRVAVLVLLLVGLRAASSRAVVVSFAVVSIAIYISWAIVVSPAVTATAVTVSVSWR